MMTAEWEHRITACTHVRYALLFVGVGITSFRSTHIHENVDKTIECAQRVTFTKDNFDLFNLCTYCLICVSKAVWTFSFSSFGVRYSLDLKFICCGMSMFIKVNLEKFNKYQFKELERNVSLLFLHVWAASIVGSLYDNWK